MNKRMQCFNLSILGKQSWVDNSELQSITQVWYCKCNICDLQRDAKYKNRLEHLPQAQSLSLGKDKCPGVSGCVWDEGVGGRPRGISAFAKVFSFFWENHANMRNY